MHPTLAQSLENAESLLRAFREDPETLAAMERITDALIECLSSGHKLLTCGNGGSMADAMHVAEEFSGRFRLDRRPYGAIALSDPAHMSCVANDYGYDHVFARQAEALLQPGDALLVMSTSGNSVSLIKAAEAARAKGATVIGALGRGGGEIRALCNLVLMAPGEGSDRIQELHMLAFHAIIEAVEQAIEGVGG